MAGEVLNTYIIVEQGNKVLFIGKHATHEWLNFDRMKAEGYQPMVQALLGPVVFTPPAEEGVALLAQLPLLGRFGFEVGDPGGRALTVRAALNDVAVGEIPDVLPELVGRLPTGGSANPDAARDALPHTMICKAVIKGGQRNSSVELLRVAQAVMSGAIKYCPRGRPVAIELTRQQLEKRFGRVRFDRTLRLQRVRVSSPLARTLSQGQFTCPEDVEPSRGFRRTGPLGNKYCPYGRPVVTELIRQQLEKRFGRA